MSCVPDYNRGLWLHRKLLVTLHWAWRSWKNTKRNQARHYYHAAYASSMWNFSFCHLVWRDFLVWKGWKPFLPSFLFKTLRKVQIIILFLKLTCRMLECYFLAQPELCLNVLPSCLWMQIYLPFTQNKHQIPTCSLSSVLISLWFRRDR